MSLEVFCEGIADTSASLLIQKVSWIVPRARATPEKSICRVRG